MKIEFYNKETDEILGNTNNYYFVMNDEVYVIHDQPEWVIDNGVYYGGVFRTGDCVQKAVGIGWRVADDG